MKKLPLSNKLIAYNPSIYPCYLFVCTVDEIDYANEKFTVYDTILDMTSKRKARQIIWNSDTTTGITLIVQEKETGVCGFLVVLKLDTYLSDHIADVVAHESVHVTDGMYEFLGMTTQSFKDGNEPYAYLLGWVAGKIADYIVYYKTNLQDE